MSSTPASSEPIAVKAPTERSNEYSEEHDGQASATVAYDEVYRPNTVSSGTLRRRRSSVGLTVTDVPVAVLVMTTDLPQYCEADPVSPYYGTEVSAGRAGELQENGPEWT